MPKALLGLGAAVLLLFLAVGAAHADEITLTPDDDFSEEDLSAQLGLDVTNASGVISFTFTNDVGTASNIAEVYFHTDLGTYLDLTSIAVDNDNGTGSTTPSFTVPTAAPGHPPGLTGWGNAQTGAAGDIGSGSSGINESGDIVVFTFDLLSTADFSDLIGALDNQDGESGALIGLHIRSIGVDGGSDTYFNGSPVPEPGTLALLGLGLIGLALGRRKRAAVARR